MKLIRFGTPQNEKPGVQLQDGTRLDVSAFGSDYDETFFGTEGIEKLSQWLEQHQDSCPVVASDVRLGAPLARPSKIVCVGLNYAKHAEESGMAPPEEPVLFFKASSAITGPFDPIRIPKGSTKTDWEVELALVIGRKASYVSEADALDYVAGYTLHNDYSERAYQLEKSGQWMLGKGCDTFAPLGPFMATADEIPNPNSLKMWLKVNGVQKQNGTTENFIFNTQHVISYLSQYMTLEPGDVISTGTPAGVGLGFKPAQYIQPGDVIELGIEGLGESAQTAKAYQA